MLPLQTWHIKDRDVRARCPTEVPWALVEAHEAQAMKNHYQTLTRLGERAGPSAAELYYILRDERFPMRGWVDDATAVDFIIARVAELRSARPPEAAAVGERS